MLEHVLAQHPELNFIPPAAKTWLGPFRKPLMHLFKLHRLFKLYDSMDRPATPQAFAEEALRVLDVRTVIKGEGLDSVPKEGPLVVVSNHPFGALEGVVLMATLLRHRPDAKFLANFILGCVPELSDCVIQVNPFESQEARRNNVKGLREAISHVSDGGCLAVFPAGEVSHLQPRQFGIIDPAWNRNVARIIRRTNADVLPLYFHGRNSMLFNLAGLIHPFARTALLPAELLKKQRSCVKLNVGRIIPGSLLGGSNGLTSEEDVTTYLRTRSYALRKPVKAPRTLTLPFVRQPQEQPVAMPRPVSSLDVELEELPAEQILVRDSGYTVFEAKAFQIPNMLHEIGRLREITFRGVGEGSGRELDLDSYDYEYDHLVLWHEADRRIAGAYRLGNVPALIKTCGKKGLYCSTLFSFKPDFFANYANSVELGRALVAQEYQRDYAPLMLLWKGIGQYLNRRPELRYLFGPCSLPLTFSQYTLSTVTRYLMHHYGNSNLSDVVLGRKAPKWKTPKGIAGDISLAELSYNGLNHLVKDLENGHGLPILFKHYLKLGGSIANFHVDASFGTLDAFLLIDLAKAPQKTLLRYMGEEAVGRFLQPHTNSA